MSLLFFDTHSGRSVLVALYAMVKKRLNLFTTLSLITKNNEFRMYKQLNILSQFPVIQVVGIAAETLCNISTGGRKICTVSNRGSRSRYRRRENDHVAKIFLLQ